MKKVIKIIGKVLLVIVAVAILVFAFVLQYPK